MRTHLAALVFISIVCDLPAVLAVEISIKPQPPASQTRSSSAPQAQQKSAQDCEGKASATGSVTALLSKLVRSSSATRGVQCPIPPVPEQATIQENNP